MDKTLQQSKLDVTVSLIATRLFLYGVLLMYPCAPENQ